ncbi:S49 family peptidase [Deinococcus sp. 6GRE01]|uniref:S49 family peptidase n=1 Tax=Deinococcus sp. 6GRE01 TaxID=2745873 RepID=UPI001E4DB180|nr:S49 family peptidase [Deinococcus sp. 6GRE01]MCD0156305.1 S49 family peptidase [Deinococcus sp. 6GRE01]
MKRNLHFLAHALQAGQLWAIQQPVLDDLHARVMNPQGHGPGADDLAEQPVALTQRVPLVRGNGKSVALVTFHGVVISRAPAWAESYGYVSPQRFGAEIRTLADDPTVSAIVLSIDSPGGTVAGTVEAGEAVAYARTKKRVVAVTNDMAASAAYWVASQASEIVVTPTAITGSIGVISTHADYTKMMNTWGIVVTYIRSAAKKALGQPYEPFSAEAQAEWQKTVDAMYAQFIQAVARGRRKARAVVAEQWASGEVWTGQAAVTAGLADRVGSLAGVLSELTGATPPTPPDPPQPDPDDDDPDAGTVPSPTANGDPDTPDAEQTTSPTDDPPATPQAGSSITPQPAPSAQEASMNIATISAKLAAGETLTAEERTFLDDHLAAQSTAAAAPATPGAGQTPQPTAKVDLSALTPEAREAVEKAQADAAAANARAERAENTANTERDQRLDREFRERAVQLGQPATFGATLRAASEKMTKDEYASLEQSLNATGAQLELIGERGSHQDRKVSSDAKAEYRTRVDTAMTADPKLTRAQAGQKVMRDDPAFAARYRNS